MNPVAISFTPSDIISLNHGQPMTSSLKVAEIFGKLHKNVLRKIESLDCSPEFSELNFEPVEYLDEKGETRKAWNMTKNGFIFLVMGFTGKMAAQFKERYIAAFDWMAEQLAHQQAKLPSYHFPVSSADPHDRKFGNAWMTPRVILDERNHAPEMELLDALERDGHDVTGAKIRIHAMYGIVKQFITMQHELSLATRHMSAVSDIIKSQTVERGENVSFTGSKLGLAYGGYTKRALPKG